MAVDQNSKDSLMIPPSKLFSTEEEEDNNSDIFPAKKKPSSRSWRSLFGYSDSCSSSSSFGSSLSSPVGSELGSIESESDHDDDYIAELTSRMAHYMLQDEDNSKHEKAWNSDGSPQPTVWSGQEEAQVMYKLENLKINEDKSFSPASILPNARNPSGSIENFRSKQALIEDQIQAIRLNKFKQDQIMKQKQSSSGYKLQMDPNTQEVRQVQSTGKACGSGLNRKNGQKVSRASNNDLQQQQQQLGTGSDTMRAASHGETGPKRGRCGTGVFLPGATTGNTSESRNKKPGCSTVLVPARVLHALKTHFDTVGFPARSETAISLLRNDGITGDVSIVLQLQQDKSHSLAVPAMNHHSEICLPQEWTY